MSASQTKSYVAPRNVRAMPESVAKAIAADSYEKFDKIGVQFAPGVVSGEGMDALISTTSPNTLGTPRQYLQTFLPGIVTQATAPTKIDELVGISTVGDWEDEEVVQMGLELTGRAYLYGDYTNIPLSSYNHLFERRQIVRFEEGFREGKLEAARAAKQGLVVSEIKKKAAARALNIQRNLIGFFGFNSTTSLTYGILNDPALPAYAPVANGASTSPLWSTKTYNEIINDLREAIEALRIQSQGAIDPSTMAFTIALPVNRVGYLSVVGATGMGVSVRNWLTETYPNARIVTVPEFNTANGGAPVMYVYVENINGVGNEGEESTDDGATFVQIVPTKLILIGSQQEAKAYVEDWGNATAGVLVKRGWAVVRRTGF